jgi:hypothetical protein
VRESVRKHTFESGLSDLIGHAEMEKEIQNTVTKIIESQDIGELHTESGFQLDGNELRRYIEVVVNEVKKMTNTLLHR